MTKEEITKVAARLGLNQSRLLADMESDKIKSIIAANRQLAETLGVSGTPTVVIGELLIPGGMSLANLKELVSKELVSKGQKTQDNLASSKDG